MTEIISVPIDNPLRRIERLPEEARAKYEAAIVDPLVARRALHGSAMDIQQDEQKALNVAERNLAAQQQGMERGDPIGGQTSRYIAPGEWGAAQQGGIEVTIETPKIEIDAAEAKVEKAKVHLERARANTAARADTVQQLGEVQIGVDGWLERLPAGAELKMHAPAIKVPDGATIENVRKHIEKLKAEHDATEHAPLPLAEQRAALAAHITALAEQGAPSISGIDQGRLKIYFPTKSEQVSVAGSTGKGDTVLCMGQAMIPDMTGFMAWLHKDELVAALERQFDLNAEDDRAMTEADRKARLAELDAEILGAARVEEALVERAIAQGQTVLRRPDTDPRAILALADHPAPRRLAAA